MEEGAQAGPADMGSAIWSQLENASTLVISGDHKQSKPSCLSMGYNEGGEVLGVSFFERMWRDPNQRFQKYTLVQQYRI